jgi:hypothetical protein
MVTLAKITKETKPEKTFDPDPDGPSQRSLQIENEVKSVIYTELLNTLGT